MISEELKKNSFLVRFSKIKIKTFFILFLILGLFISSYKPFQFRINQIHLPYILFPYEKNDNKICTINYSYECKLFDALKIIDTVINDITFLILSIYLDVFLFKTFKKEMANKKKILNTSKFDDLKKKQDDVVKMIIINGLIYATSHLPVFFLSLLLIIYSKTIFKFCTYKYSCDLINEIAKFFCLIPMLLQFFILVRFNFNFRKSFKDILENFFRKKPK
jgi:hypothetical protein